MRKRFEIQYELGTIPIEKIGLPLDSRDELPPVLRALQYIYSTPELNKKVFDLLEAQIMAGVQQTGCPGMSLWEILVFSTIRLALDADYDRLHHIANYDSLVRSFLGISNFGEKLKKYSLQSLKDNIRLLDEETIDQINDIVVNAGHRLKKIDRLDIKVDSYVLETNVHFPTDLNLLWDAGRKCIALANQILQGVLISGWRKYRNWRNRLKSAYHKAARQAMNAGKNTTRGLHAVVDYLSLARDLSQKIKQTKALLETNAETNPHNTKKLNELLYFEQQLDKHIDLVQRRLIHRETIPHEEKIFSLFEPFTEWIKKGKTRHEVELGLRIAVATDQQGFILRHHVMKQEQDVDIAVPLTQELLIWNTINSVSFDKAFWSPQNYNKLKPLVHELMMPKKGKLSKAEHEREHSKSFTALRRNHAAVESAINCLEHHGLNRCPDKGLKSFQRYTSLGVLAYNLHKLGNILIKEDREQLSKNTFLPRAA
jgi:hypothetical protein